MLDLMPPATSSRSFADLIAPVTVREFIDEYWETRHLFIHRNVPSFYRDVFDAFADVDRWLTAARTNPEAVVLLVPPKSTNRNITRLRPRDVSLNRLYTAFSGGQTIVLEGIERAWPPVAELAADLEQALSAGVKINLYMTPPGAQGVAVHPDMQDVLVLQVGGAKDWKIYQATSELPVEKLIYWRQLNRPYLESLRSLDQASLIDEARLEQGDLLYIPRGLPHEAIAPAETASVHLTVTLHPVLWIDFLKAALEVAAIRSRDLRRSLPPGFLQDGEARRQMAAQFAQRLQQTAGNATFESTLEVVTAAEMAHQTMIGDGHFEQLLHLDEITPTSMVRRRPGLVCRLDVGPDAAVLHFGGTQLKLPTALAPALELVCDHPWFEVSKLPGDLDDDARVLLVRRLVQQGLLRVEHATQDEGDIVGR